MWMWWLRETQICVGTRRDSPQSTVWHYADVVELVDTLALGASASRRGGENCQWQFGNESSDENCVFNRKVRGSRNVTKSSITILEPYKLVMREW